MHGINLNFSGNILQYWKQGLNQNYTQKIICPFFKKSNNKFYPFFYINRNGHHYEKWKNCQKILVQTFECLEGSNSPKHQQKICIGSWDSDVQKSALFFHFSSWLSIKIWKKVFSLSLVFLRSCLLVLWKGWWTVFLKRKFFYLWPTLKFLTKPITLLYWYVTEYQYPQTCTLGSKNKFHITLNLV